MDNITKKNQYTRTITIGDIIDRIMSMREISNADLAKKAGVSKNTIGVLRRDKASYSYGIRLSTIRAIAEALDVPPRLLYKAPYIVEVKKGIELRMEEKE